jgi:hypothetical protein
LRQNAFCALSTPWWKKIGGPFSSVEREIAGVGGSKSVSLRWHYPDQVRRV